jgi:poly(3-hydroxybutyrate) depolymerase
MPSKLIVTILLLTALLGAQPSKGDQNLQESIVSGGIKRTYRLFIPDGFGRSGPAPALVMFNGSGSRVEPLFDQWKDVARKEGVMLIGPGAIKAGAWRIPEDSPDFTHDVVEAAKEKFPIDPRRVYLMGHSGGAGHVLMLGLLESEYFAAVAAHAGVLREQDAPYLGMARRKIPMAIWIGTSDQLVPLKMARDTLAALTQRGFPARLTEMKGHTHSYADSGKEVTRAAWEFLKKEGLPGDPHYYLYRFPQPSLRGPKSVIASWKRSFPG